VVEKKYQLTATVNSASPLVLKPVIERVVGSKGTVKAVGEGFEVKAEFTGESARDLNRMVLSELRRAEKKTSIRSEWTNGDTVEKFFDYALKGTRKTSEK
jgi:hypothetical protein